MPFPFEADYDDLQANMDAYVDEVFSSLESEFLVMPKGPGFVDFSIFEAGYEALKRATRSFQEVTPESIARIVQETPISLIVLRCILGFTPPEWAYCASRHTGVEVPQGTARSIDRSIRLDPGKPLYLDRGSITSERIAALIATACDILEKGAPAVARDRLHRIEPGRSGEQSPNLALELIRAVEMAAPPVAAYPAGPPTPHAGARRTATYTHPSAASRRSVGLTARARPCCRPAPGMPS